MRKVWHLIDEWESRDTHIFALTPLLTCSPPFHAFTSCISYHVGRRMGEGSCKLHSNMRDLFFFFFCRSRFVESWETEVSSYFAAWNVPILYVSVYFTQFRMPTPEDTPTEEMFFMQMCGLMWGEELFVAKRSRNELIKAYCSVWK